MAKPIFLSLTCQTFVFCSDSARLGEKIPQRSEDDFFSQPVQRTALLDQGQKATFAGKKQKCGTLLDSKVENLCPANLYIHPIKIRQGKSVFKRFLGPFRKHLKSGYSPNVHYRSSNASTLFLSSKARMSFSLYSNLPPIL